jgi:outer membrane protein insertion porin family
VCLRGAKRKEADLRALLRSRADAPLDREAVAADLGKLYDTGLIADARAELTPSAEGLVLTFVVEERKLLGRARVEGAHAAPINVDLGTEGGAAPLYNPTNVRAAELRLRDQYVDAGYLHVKLTTEASPIDADHVDLVLKVEEGPQVKVAALSFPGAKQYREADLLKALGTRVGAPFNPTLLTRDVLLAEAGYYDRGMLKIKVGDPEIVEAPDHTSVAIRVPVTEGPVFRIRKLDFKDVPAEQLAAYRPMLKAKAGDVFNRSVLIAALRTIHEQRHAQGLTTELEPSLVLDPQKRAVDVTLSVK